MIVLVRGLARPKGKDDKETTLRGGKNASNQTASSIQPIEEKQFQSQATWQGMLFEVSRRHVRKTQAERAAYLMSVPRGDGPPVLFFLLAVRLQRFSCPILNQRFGRGFEFFHLHCNHQCWFSQLRVQMQQSWHWSFGVHIPRLSPCCARLTPASFDRLR